MLAPLPPTGTRETVLIVDDEPTLRGLTAGRLIQLGYHTIEARNAAEALSIADEIQADLVLTDVMMPGMNGWDLIRELQRRGYAGKYLLMSGFTVGQNRASDDVH